MNRNLVWQIRKIKNLQKIPVLCHKPEFSFVIIYVGAKNLLIMKNKWMRKLFALCMCLTVFFNSGVMAFASESPSVMPRYTYIQNYSLSLYVADDNAHINAKLTGKSGVTESYIKCNLEKLMGSYWMQLKSFSTTDTDFAALIVDYPVDRGTYRVMGIFRCNTETQTAYSGNYTY